MLNWIVGSPTLSALLTSLALIALSCLLLDGSMVMWLCLNMWISANMCLCGGQFSRRLCSTWPSDACSPVSPHLPHTVQPLPSRPLPLHLPLTAHTRGRAKLLFSASNLLPIFSPPPFLSFSWLNLFSGLILLKTIWCVTSPGQEAGRREW